VRVRPVLTVEAEPALRTHLKGLLEEWGYEPIGVGSVDEALAALATSQFEFSLVDMDLDGTDGIDFLHRLKVQGGDPGPIILLFDPPDTKRIADAAALGADDFLQKPFKPEELENAIKAACLAPRRVWGRTAADDVAPRLEHEVSLWRSPRMQEVWRVIEQAAQVDITVLLCGETGTGKDLAARAIHHLSSRRRRPFVKVNCAAVPRELLESELFGHERGAFTGAHQMKMGKFESADHGAIFLDEIGDLHPALQAKLLHVLQDGEFKRIGSTRPIRVDVRVIAATNKDLIQAIADKSFREDLFYRLNVIPVHIPPLRERKEDIPLLINHFLTEFNKELGKAVEGFSPAAIQKMMTYQWPGNIRELKNKVKQAMVLTRNNVITAEDLFFHVPVSSNKFQSFKEAKREFEKEYISQVLRICQGNISQAARLAKKDRKDFYDVMKKYGIQPEAFRKQQAS